MEMEIGMITITIREDIVLVEVVLYGKIQKEVGMVIKVEMIFLVDLIIMEIDLLAMVLVADLMVIMAFMAVDSMEMALVIDLVVTMVYLEMDFKAMVVFLVMVADEVVKEI